MASKRSEAKASADFGRQCQIVAATYQHKSPHPRGKQILQSVFCAFLFIIQECTKSEKFDQDGSNDEACTPVKNSIFINFASSWHVLNLSYVSQSARHRSKYCHFLDMFLVKISARLHILLRGHTLRPGGVKVFGEFSISLLCTCFSFRKTFISTTCT